LSWLAIGVVTIVMAISAALQGAVGFGLGMLAIPVLIHLDVRFVPGPLLVAALTLHMLVLRRDRSGVFTAGTASGFMATAAGLGGPPVALVYQHSPGRRLRGTLAAYFIIGTVFSLAALAWAGRFGVDELRLSAFLIPGTILGFLLSHPAAAYLDGGYTRTAVLAVSALAAITVIATVMF
jgi:uncharacterized membrane protein YfcA